MAGIRIFFNADLAVTRSRDHEPERSHNLYEKKISLSRCTSFWQASHAAQSLKSR
jgi:hypothetical protein